MLRGFNKMIVKTQKYRQDVVATNDAGDDLSS